MIEKEAISPSVGQEQRAYFTVEADFKYFTSKPQYEWKNRDELGKYKMGPKQFNLGFRESWREKIPSILIKRVGKRNPLDIFLFDTAWMISGRLKRLLEAFDCDAFEFLPTNTAYGKDLKEDEPYWLCDVVRVLDCVDESASDIRYHENIAWKSYRTIIKAVMIEEKIGESRVFRLFHQSATRIYVDQSFLDLVHENGITGFLFTSLDGSLSEIR